MNSSTTKAPFHLWIIGILAVLWNAMGAFDYAATQMKLDFYMSQFSPEQLDYFYNFPAWADAGWAIAVWGALLASLVLLMRKAFAVWLFGISILGMAATAVYTFFLTDSSSVMGEDALMFTAVIWVIAIFLYFYSIAMAKRRVLG
jgi:hypothetical protein